MAARALTVTPYLSQSLHCLRYGRAEPVFSPFQSWGPRARPCRALSQTQDGESWQEHTHLPGAWPGWDWSMPLRLHECSPQPIPLAGSSIP